MGYAGKVVGIERMTKNPKPGFNFRGLVQGGAGRGGRAR